MKKQFLLLACIVVAAALRLSAQVQIDKPIQMTGAGTDAAITGIKSVANTQDAVSADYIQRDSLKFGMAAGSNNAYSVSLTPAVTGQYSVGMIVHFIANFANTAAATLNVNGLGAVTLKKNYNADLASGDIQSGQAVSVIYDGTHFQVLSQLPQSGTSAASNLNFSLTDTVTGGIIVGQGSNSSGTPFLLNCTYVSGNAAPVTLSISGLPAGATYVFVGPAGGYPSFSTTVVFYTTTAVATGSYPVTVTATGGATPQSVSINLIVSAVKRVFVTSAQYQGNFGSNLTAADNDCQTLANAAGLGSTWVAWLSTSSINAISRLNPNFYVYTNLNNQPLANGTVAFTGMTPMFNNVDYTESGNLYTGPVITGTNGYGGSFFSTQYNCNDWTDNTSNYMAYYYVTIYGWTGQGGIPCNTPTPIFCFEK